VSGEEREYAGAEHCRALERDQQHVPEQAQHETKQDELPVARLERAHGECDPEERERGDRLRDPQARARSPPLGPQQARDRDGAQQVRTQVAHAST
jgi:hypothetical protein